MIVDKVKDISECTERYQMHSIIPTSPYVFQSVSVGFTFHKTIKHLGMGLMKNFPFFSLQMEI